jgi:hypothetical protein
VKWRGPLVFGMVDGMTLILGLLLGDIVAHESASAIWHSALGGGLAEFGGMSLGQYWSDEKKDKLGALLNGGGCCIIVLLAGAPFAVSSGAIPSIVSLCLVLAAAVGICFLREERGMVAFIRTFGLLAIAGAMSGASGFI